MRIKGVVVLAGLSVMLTGQAMAQQQPAGGFTPQQLDQMSQQRMKEEGPRNWGPPPPLSSVPAVNLQQPTQLMVCMSVDPWQPIYAAPRVSSAVIGKTLQEVAVKGPTTDGFVPVLYGPGRTGYVPASEVRPFQSTVKPGLTCTVEIRPNGSPVFDLH